MKPVCLAGCAAILACTMASAASAQASRNVWDGVYTEAQAGRGKKLYIQSCAACHQEGLQGADLAPPLKGEDFLLRWSDQTMYDLVSTVAKTMPADAPGSLSPEANADIVAYMLQVNRLPTGAEELAADEAKQEAIVITKTK